MNNNKLNNEDSLEIFIKNLDSIKGKKTKFIEDCKKVLPRISTGFLSIDKALNGGLTNELYIVGAEQGTGKSAFLMTLAQNIAKQGINVLYFSLEMGYQEFVARAISAISFENNEKNNKKGRVAASDILYWTYDEEMCDFKKTPYDAYKEYAEEYFENFGECLYIIETEINGFCARDISDIAMHFKKEHPDKQVVVFIDYLQIIKADPMDHFQSDRKTKTDVAVTVLKHLALQVGIPVVTISSIGRTNYNDKVSSSSYKESGDIEYTAGILIGWNWHGVTDVSDKSIAEVERKACEERGYRRIIFEIIKYRNSQRDHAIKLLYYPGYNYFIDELEWISSGKITRNMKNPFKNWENDIKEISSKNSKITKPRKSF